MNKVGSYEAYQNSLYERTKAAKEADAVGAAKTGTGTVDVSNRVNSAEMGSHTNSTGKNSPASSAEKSSKMSETAKSGWVTLSEDAKNLLKELKKKYGNMDFIIADYETDEEAERYLARGTGEYSVLLTPEELEKMAADESYKKQNLSILDDAVSKLGEMKTQLGDKEHEVSRIGIAIDSEGKISYFAELEKVNEKQRERIEKRREERREESREGSKRADSSAKTGERIGKNEAEERIQKKEAEESKEPVKRTVVRADSVEALLKRIEEVDWSAVKAEEEQLQGRRIDFMA